MAGGGYWCDETDQECAPRYNQRAQGSNNMCVQWEHASIETSTVMNVLGYGSHIRQARRDAYWEIDRRASAYDMITQLISGSKAEGLTSLFESDIDMLFVLNCVMCLENDVNYDTLSRDTTVFILNTDMCYHGHCILFMKERPNAVIHPVVHEALCTNQYGRVFLSSDLYVNVFKRVGCNPAEVPHERAGPSLPWSYGGIVHADHVFSFHCNCPSILRKYAERRRHWREGLKELRSAILMEYLSYYMIPERNLMASCGLDEEQKRAWIKMITEMIDEGPKVLLRLPTIRRSIVSHPEPLLWYSKKRVELELLCLKTMILTRQCSDYNGEVNRSDTILQALDIRTNEIVKEILKRMYLEGSRFDDSMKCAVLLFGMN